MSREKREVLALRKQVLLARASLQRLQVAAQVDSLRQGLRIPRVASTVLATPQGRSIAIGAVLFLARRFRMLKVARIAIVAFGAAKLARSILGDRSLASFFGERRAPAGEPEFAPRASVGAVPVHDYGRAAPDAPGAAGIPRAEP